MILEFASIIIDTSVIPYDSLEFLAYISDFTIENSLLLARPHIIRMSRAFQKIENQPLTVWLKKHCPGYHNAFQQISKRWGKQIVHENLMIAKINDLSLKVDIEKSFTSYNDVIFLSKNFMVFPKYLLTEIEKKLSKSGHVIKSVTPNE